MDPDARRLALHLMELFPDGRYLPVLERAAQQETGNLRRQALRSLITQIQTPDWEAILIRLLDSPEETVRAAAIESLSRRRTESAHQALTEHLPREANPDLQARIRQTL